MEPEERMMVYKSLENGILLPGRIDFISWFLDHLNNKGRDSEKKGCERVVCAMNELFERRGL